jgi:glyoxylase-like metal-dependent hydrolase (beta-lactamase superfamily II)
MRVICGTATTEDLMTKLTRRHLLTTTVAATAATAMTPLSGPSPAHAAAPPAGKQAPGWYRYKVGSIEVTVVTDGARTFPLAETFVTNAKPDEVNAALAAAYMETGKVTIVFNPIVVNTGSKLVVIDTGFGEAGYALTKGAAGQFHTNLAAAGIAAKDVDAVIISHFHQDHTDGLLTADNKSAFPNAEIMVPAPEWAFWMDDGEMSRAPKGRMEGLFKNNRRVFDALARKVTPYESNKEIAPGITSIATPGHTVGHTSYVIASGSSKIFVQSDVTNHPALFVRNPAWHAFFDQDGAKAEETRRKVYDMLVADKMLVQAFHYPFPSLAYVEKAGSGYREVPVPWNPTI